MFLKICFWKYNVFENIMFLKISCFWKYHILQYMMYSNTSCFQNIMFSYFEALTTNLPNHQQPPCQPSPGACRRPRRTQSLTWIMRTKSSWSVDPLRSVANIDLQARAARAGPAAMWGSSSSATPVASGSGRLPNHSWIIGFLDLINGSKHLCCFFFLVQPLWLILTTIKAWKYFNLVRTFLRQKLVCVSQSVSQSVSESVSQSVSPSVS